MRTGAGCQRNGPVYSTSDQFLSRLRAELGFYIACLNLSEALSHRNIPLCFPVPIYKRERYLVFYSLFDTCLALTSSDTIISNTLKEDSKNTFIITGANQEENRRSYAASAWPR
jgi:DNA mismatch repair ATPase MutS